MKDLDLAKLLLAARRHPMTLEQREAQRRSFAFGNASVENPRITRELVDRVADEMAAEFEGRSNV